ncbi:MAG: hypothetical protein JW876_07340 [Candidatus Krumholzibacteriota bacterium]|nr:hypothetical protein [Candidatus Krumholzibacteriota bacterium]
MKRFCIALALAAALAAGCDDETATTSDPGGGGGGGGGGDTTGAIIVDHACIDLDRIPSWAIDAAKEQLRIAYEHTSHGSQITSGMSGLVGFAGDDYRYSSTGGEGILALRTDVSTSAYDLGSPNFTAWEGATREFLAAHPEINVVMWAWCGQVSDASVADIELYLSLMSGLEADYPGVRFVYMTGHLDGTGLDGNLHLRNEQIRDYCRTNERALYDFADIETYDPDGVWYGDRIPTDECEYDSDGDGERDANWGLEWQAAHTEGVDWYVCDADHTQPVNANMKAYAAWWLFARLAGWDGE